MALLKLPRLPLSVDIVTTSRKPTNLFQQWWQSVVTLIENQVNQNTALIEAIQAAQDAADAANEAATLAAEAADDATTAASAAATAASNAQTATDNLASTTSLANSYPTGCDITGKAFDEEVEITAHSRIYGDGSTVSVDGGTLTSGTVVYGGTYYIFYDDPARAGGTVTYDASTSFSDAVPSAANPHRHYVGSIVMPGSLADPDTVGQPALPPTVIPPS